MERVDGRPRPVAATLPGASQRGCPTAAHFFPRLLFTMGLHRLFLSLILHRNRQTRLQAIRVTLCPVGQEGRLSWARALSSISRSWADSHHTNLEVAGGHSWGGPGLVGFA